MVQAILTIGLVLMVSLLMVRSLDLKKVYPESPPTATSSHGLSGGAAQDILTGNPRDMVAPSPRLPGRRSRARKKGRKRKKEGARSTWERRLREMSSQNAADRACVSWTPDLKVKVNTTEQTIWVDYCTDSASPRTRTCILEVHNSSSASPSTAAECQVLDQGNCATKFYTLEAGTSYKLMVQPYCRCQGRSVDPCAVAVTYGGPYHIPATTPPKISGKDSVRSNTGSVIFLTTYCTGVLVILAVGFLAWTRCRPKSSSSHSAQEVPGGDQEMQPMGGAEPPPPPPLGSGHSYSSSPPSYYWTDDRGSRTDSSALHTGSQTLLKEECANNDVHTQYKERYGYADCRSMETLCTNPLVGGACGTNQRLSPPGLLGMNRVKYEESRPCGAAQATGGSSVNDGAVSTVQTRHRHYLARPETYRGRGEAMATSPQKGKNMIQDQASQEWKVVCNSDTGCGGALQALRTERRRTPRPTCGDCDHLHRMALLEQPQRLPGRISPDSFNMIKIPVDILFENAGT